MLLRDRRRASVPTSVELVEIVTPRTNAAVITPAENLLAALQGRRPPDLVNPEAWHDPDGTGPPR